MKIYRLPEVQNETGYARATIYSRIKQGLFTKPVKIGRRLSGWPSTEVEAITAALIAGKSEDQLRNLVRTLEQNRRGGSSNE